MNVADFATPRAEMAEMNRIYYELEFTEGINQRMRIPEMLRVAPCSPENSGENLELFNCVTMQVPERIGVAGESGNSRFSRPVDMDLIQSTLLLNAPPRVLTLNEGPLDSMELGHSAASAQPIEETRFQGRLRRERSASENALMRHSGQLNDSTVTPFPTAPVGACPPPTMVEDEQNLHSPSSVLSFIQSTTRRAYQQVLEVLDENHHSKPSLRGGLESAPNPLHESRLPLSALDTTLDGASEDMAVVDATTLRRQIIKLNRRLQLLEEENKERAKREMILYSVTIAFWLINSWVWLRR